MERMVIGVWAQVQKAKQQKKREQKQEKLRAYYAAIREKERAAKATGKAQHQDWRLTSRMQDSGLNPDCAVCRAVPERRSRDRRVPIRCGARSC